jgi:ergothioneine biosynthesis protein EgtB
LNTRAEAQALAALARTVRGNQYEPKRHWNSMTFVNDRNTMATVSLVEQYRNVRAFSERLAAPLSPEDCMVQSMPDASPTRWHLGHTTWFFETFVLGQLDGFREFDPEFRYLFNSYYESIGPQFPRPRRGLISRPGLERIRQYRMHVDAEMERWFACNESTEELSRVVQVGLNHEQQHQELILTDIKHALSCNPTLPSYQSMPFDKSVESDGGWIQIDRGLYEIGHEGTGFAFDNEFPRHHVLLHDAAVSKQLVDCCEFIDFIQDGGYRRPELWLSLGWTAVQQQGWDSPLYWVQRDGQWFQFTLAGLQPVDPNWPVCHVSYFEADAFARWAGVRLPTEFEWEVAAGQAGPGCGQFVDQLLEHDFAIHPTKSTASGSGPWPFGGGVWQWTSSSYAAYPGYQAPPGALGEYNGKFMCNQYVLRGGSVATSSDHVRLTYRNFFPPDARWQFSGIRLAR